MIGPNRDRWDWWAERINRRNLEERTREEREGDPVASQAGSHQPARWSRVYGSKER